MCDPLLLNSKQGVFNYSYSPSIALKLKNKNVAKKECHFASCYKIFCCYYILLNKLVYYIIIEIGWVSQLYVKLTIYFKTNSLLNVLNGLPCSQMFSRLLNCCGSVFFISPGSWLNSFAPEYGGLLLYRLSRWAERAIF